MKLRGLIGGGNAPLRDAKLFRLVFNKGATHSATGSPGLSGGLINDKRTVWEVVGDVLC